MGILKVLGYLRLAFVFAVPFTVLVEESGKPGPEKRAEVVEMLLQELAANGIVFPSWAATYKKTVLGLIVDVVVAILHRVGFFEHGEQ